MKQLVITADDFGLNAQIDQGIREVCEKGIVTNVSLVANGESTAEAAEFVLRNPKISASLHLNVTDGEPLAGKGGLEALLNAEGNFRGSHARAAVLLAWGGVSKRAVEREYRAQLECVLARGVRLAQLNCHGHLHGTPTVYRLLTHLAREYKIPFVRVIEEWPHFGSWVRSPRAWIKTVTLSAAFRLTKDSSGGQVVRRCRAIGAFDSGRLVKKERFGEILRNLGEGLSELICHPGAEAGDLGARYRWGYHWEEELQLFSSHDRRQEIKHLGIDLLNFWQALEKGRGNV